MKSISRVKKTARNPKRKVGDWYVFRDDSLDKKPDQCSGYIIDPLIGFDYISPDRRTFRLDQGCEKRKVSATKLGKGSSGSVYDTTCKGKVGYVTKVIPIPFRPEHLYSEIYFQQLAAKAGLAPKILESVVSGKNVLITMEKINGLTLAAILENDPSGKTLIALVPKIAEAIRRLHALGIAHRDIHIENVIVTRKGEVKIIDFGRATRLIGSDGRLDLSHLKMDYAFLTELNDIPNIPNFTNLLNVRRALVRRLDPYVLKDLKAYANGEYVFTGALEKKSVKKARKNK